MTASGTLSHDGTRRFTGSKSVTVCLVWQAGGRHLDSASLASLPGLGSSAPRPVSKRLPRQPMVQADLLDYVMHVLDDHHDT